ncbi:hypothetical protein SEPCBS119000_005254 [Sporothrix epigloea]|uniref:Spt20-like SEP domain-containing protein n=1 Tax=Sporothrix epigloea TaxID=1892477 RepID=A0ABP0DWL5_9PEZI
MAPISVTAVPPPTIPTKPKRPTPAGIQTNGASSVRSSPSPSLTNKKPPVAGKSVAHTSSTVPNGMTVTPVRPPNRAPRMPPIQTSGFGAGNDAKYNGLQTISAPRINLSVSADRRPYDVTSVITSKYILRKFAGNPPSLVVHLHAAHFRFDQQDGIFPYKSPMRIFLEHLKSQTIPHDLVEQFKQGGVPFYEGCLIVQVHDHKSVTQSKDSTRLTQLQNSTLSSIHNYDPYITPSAFAPYPKDSMNSANKMGPVSADRQVKEKSAGESAADVKESKGLSDGDNAKAAPKPKIFTVVLKPTPESMHADIALMANTPKDATDGRDANGMTYIPPPPPMLPAPAAKKQKRERMQLDSSNVPEFEAQVLLATNPELDLDPVTSPGGMRRKLEAQAHPDHEGALPQPKTRKRTVAELAAYEALAATQERYMLAEDERLSADASGSQSAAAGGVGDLQGGSAVFEPRFERFKLIEQIKRDHQERREEEKAKQQERERAALQLKMEQQQAAAAREQAMAEQREREQERARLLQQQKAEKAQQAQQAAREQQARDQQAALLEAQRKKLAAQAAAKQQAQQNQAQAAQAAQAQAQAQAHAAQAQLQAQALAQNQARAQAQGMQNQPRTPGQQNATVAQKMATHNANAAAAAAMGQSQSGMVNGFSNGLPNGIPNGLPAGMTAQQFQNAQMQAARMHMAAQQATASSPRIGTPQNMSSPMVSAVPMQPSRSSMAGSPPRPPSVAQNHGPMAVNMAARGSQQSHPSNTPRMPNATPNLQQQVATPINRPQQMATPRMAAQASPTPGMMTPQQAQFLLQQNMNAAAAMGTPQMANSATAAQRLQLQQRMQQAMQNGMMTPQLQSQFMQQQRVAAMRAAAAGAQGAQQQQAAMFQMIQAQQIQQAQQQAAQQAQQAGLTPQQQQQLQQQLLGQLQQQQHHQLQQHIQQQQQQQQQHQQQQPNQQQHPHQQQQQQQQQQHQLQQQQQQQQNMQALLQRQMLNGQNLSASQISQVQQLQQNRQQQQQHQQAQLVQQQRQRIFQSNVGALAQRYGGEKNIPPEEMANFQKMCLLQAQQSVTNLLHQRRQHVAAVMQQQQQQQQALQAGMAASAQNLGQPGMPHGMSQGMAQGMGQGLSQGMQGIPQGMSQAAAAAALSQNMNGLGGMMP